MDLKFGQQNHEDKDAVVRLSPGQHLSIDISMRRGGAINGRVISEYGEPLHGLKVEAYRVEHTGVGSRLSRVSATAYPSNDIGQFRIANLLSGTYYLAVSSAGELNSSEAQRLTVWYPGTPDSAQASSIDVQLGQEVTVRDFILGMYEGSTVRGVVLRVDGSAAADGVVQLLPMHNTSTAPQNGRSARIRLGGEFTIARVPPGGYKVYAQSQVARDRTEFSMTTLFVTGDTGQVVLQLRPAAAVRGRIEGSGLYLRDGLRITAHQIQSPLAKSTTSSSVKADGSFELALAPGDWSLSVSGLPGMAAVQSITSRSIDDEGWLAIGTSNVEDLRLLIEPLGATIIGEIIVLGAARDLVVAVMSDRPISHPDAVYGVVLAKVLNGRFSVPNLPAGTYSVAALTLEDPAELQDPNVRKRLLHSASSVSLLRGGVSRISLRFTDSIQLHEAYGAVAR